MIKRLLLVLSPLWLILLIYIYVCISAIITRLEYQPNIYYVEELKLFVKLEFIGMDGNLYMQFSKDKYFDKDDYIIIRELYYPGDGINCYFNQQNDSVFISESDCVKFASQELIIIECSDKYLTETNIKVMGLDKPSYPYINVRFVKISYYNGILILYDSLGNRRELQSTISMNVSK